VLVQSDFKNLYGIMLTYTDIKNQYMNINNADHKKTIHAAMHAGTHE